MATLGYINNNPGNIRLIHSSDAPFIGELRPSNQGFRVFSSMPYGYRALMKNIQAQVRAGNNTLSKLIHAWAPYGDGNNNPDHYASNVSGWTGIGLNEYLPVGGPAEAEDWDMYLKSLAEAISRQENGINANMSDVYAGFDLLGIQSAPATTQQILGTQIKPWYKRPEYVIPGIAILAVGTAIAIKHANK